MKLKIKPLNLKLTMNSGQPANFIFCFNEKENRFERIFENKLIWVKQEAKTNEKKKNKLNENCLIETNDVKYFKEFFRAKDDYKKIYKHISTDAFMKKAVKDYSGLRLTKNDLWESIVCFTLSSNNSIGNIRNATQNLMKKYGEEINGLYSFPSIEAIAQAKTCDLRKCKTGFRDKYLKEAAQKLIQDKPNFKKMNLNQVIDYFVSFKGIGLKIANCIALFGFGFENAFPVDVWVKRGMQANYFKNEETNNELIEMKAFNLWQPFQGIAQQYLFYEFMKNKRKK